MDDIGNYKFLGLHFCFEETHPDFLGTAGISPADKTILRELAKETAEYASDPVNAERKERWRKLNGLEAEKPMVWFDELCWNEMEVDGELSPRSSDPFCRKIEAGLRKQIYQWKHMQGDMVIEPVVHAPLAISNSGLGLNKEMDFIRTDEKNDVVSRHFIITIRDEADLERIGYPEISCDRTLSETAFSKYCEIFDGIMKVERQGAPGFWFAPWDDIVMYTGVQEALTDLVDRPDFIKGMVSRFVDIGLSVLDRYEALGLVSSNNGNVRVGSGGYGYTDGLPVRNGDGRVSGCKDIWGCCAAQIFAGVSPDMHEEFALQFERQWLARFGMTYYGCCEPLHDKIGKLRTIGNLRKISVSPFADLRRAREAIGDDYVLSYKPSPSIFALGAWDSEAVEKDMRSYFAVLGNANAEIIMKDISTVGYQPHRLWDWVRMASRISRESMG